MSAAVHLKTIITAAAQMPRLLKEHGIDDPTWNLQATVLTGMIEEVFVISVEDPNSRGSWHYFYFEANTGEFLKHYQWREPASA